MKKEIKIEQERVNDRRTGNDRRMGGVSQYAGPEKRKIKFRRTGFDRRD